MRLPSSPGHVQAVLINDLETKAKELTTDRAPDPLAFIRLMTELMMYDKSLVSLAAMDDYDADRNESQTVEAIAVSVACARAGGCSTCRRTSTRL